ncbi:MAG: hypothetical protein ACFHVJ_10885 [Aestuariibacter sp.]
MFTDEFNEAENAVSLKGKPTHVVNQVIEYEGQTYRIPVGNGWLEGKLEGRMELMTALGDLEVVPCEAMPQPPIHKMAEQLELSPEQYLH